MLWRAVAAAVVARVVLLVTPLVALLGAWVGRRGPRRLVARWEGWGRVTVVTVVAVVAVQASLVQVLGAGLTRRLGTRGEVEIRSGRRLKSLI